MSTANVQNRTGKCLEMTWRMSVRVTTPMGLWAASTTKTRCTPVRATISDTCISVASLFTKPPRAAVRLWRSVRLNERGQHLKHETAPSLWRTLMKSATGMVKVIKFSCVTPYETSSSETRKARGPMPRCTLRSEAEMVPTKCPSSSTTATPDTLNLLQMHS